MSFLASPCRILQLILPSLTWIPSTHPFRSLRPPLPRELNNADGRVYQPAVKVEHDQCIVISENIRAIEEGGIAAAGLYPTHSFTFDHVYDQHCDQKKVYDTTAKAVVESSLKGYNATIFAVS